MTTRQCVHSTAVSMRYRLISRGEGRSSRIRSEAALDAWVALARAPDAVAEPGAALWVGHADDREPRRRAGAALAGEGVGARPRVPLRRQRVRGDPDLRRPALRAGAPPRAAGALGGADRPGAALGRGPPGAGAPAAA